VVRPSSSLQVKRHSAPKRTGMQGPVIDSIQSDIASHANRSRHYTAMGQGRLAHLVAGNLKDCVLLLLVQQFAKTAGRCRASRLLSWSLRVFRFRSAHPRNESRITRQYANNVRT